MTVKFSGGIRAQVIQPDVLNRFAFTAGESLGEHEAVAKGESDGRVYRAQADDSTRMPAIGIALAAVTVGETVYVTDQGIIKDIAGGGSFGRDEAIFVSKTRGQVTNAMPQVSGDFAQYMGRSINATDVMLNIAAQVVQVNP